MSSDQVKAAKLAGLLGSKGLTITTLNWQPLVGLVWQRIQEPLTSKLGLFGRMQRVNKLAYTGLLKAAKFVAAYHDFSLV